MSSLADGTKDYVLYASIFVPEYQLIHYWCEYFIIEFEIDYLSYVIVCIIFVSTFPLDKVKLQVNSIRIL